MVWMAVVHTRQADRNGKLGFSYKYTRKKQPLTNYDLEIASISQEGKETLIEYTINPNDKYTILIWSIITGILILISIGICIVIYNQVKQNEKLGIVIKLGGSDRVPMHPTTDLMPNPKPVRYEESAENNPIQGQTRRDNLETIRNMKKYFDENKNQNQNIYKIEEEKNGPGEIKELKHA